MSGIVLPFTKPAHEPIASSLDAAELAYNANVARRWTALMASTDAAEVDAAIKCASKMLVELGACVRDEDSSSYLVAACVTSIHDVDDTLRRLRVRAATLRPSCPIIRLSTYRHAVADRRVRSDRRHARALEMATVKP